MYVFKSVIFLKTVYIQLLKSFKYNIKYLSYYLNPLKTIIEKTINELLLQTILLLQHVIREPR